MYWDFELPTDDPAKRVLEAIKGVSGDLKSLALALTALSVFQSSPELMEPDGWVRTCFCGDRTRPRAYPQVEFEAALEWLELDELVTLQVDDGHPVASLAGFEVTRSTPEAPRSAGSITQWAAAILYASGVRRGMTSEQQTDLMCLAASESRISEVCAAAAALLNGLGPWRQTYSDERVASFAALAADTAHRAATLQ